MRYESDVNTIRLVKQKHSVCEATRSDAKRREAITKAKDAMQKRIEKEEKTSSTR
jgi:hypothetical protein